MEGSSRDVSSAAGRDRPFRFDTASYERLLRRVLDAGRPFIGFDDREVREGVVLHHDVDLSLDRALAMARLEATLRIDGTYCVQMDLPIHDTSTVTFAQTVRTLSQLGHEVGLRFDPRIHWEEPPSDAAIRRRIDDRREVLSRLIGESVEVVSLRRPTERLRRLELEGAINACRRPDVPGYRRVSDREWVGCEPLAEGVPARFRLLVHPGLWHPVERSESEILETYRRAAHERVDAYFDALDPSDSAE
jgi:hypothetical protein